MVKQIYTAAETYYQETGGFPGEHEFNDASTKNDTWTAYTGLVVDRPSGYPRFAYSIDAGSGGAVFNARGSSTDSWDASLHDVPDILVNNVGQITGGE